MRFWPSTKTKVDRYQLLNDLLNRNGRWIEVADLKAGTTLVFVTAFLGALIPSAAGATCKLVTELRQEPSLFEVAQAAWTGALVLATGIPGSRSVANALHALIPATSRDRYRGNVFFGDIAITEFGSWQAAVGREPLAGIYRDLEEQVHVTARIASVKMARVNLALRHTVRFVLPFGIALYASSLLIG